MKPTLRYVKITVLGLVFLGVTALVVYAQQITGTPGSPSATTTIQGDQLPPPPQKFGGKIGRNTAQSRPIFS